MTTPTMWSPLAAEARVFRFQPVDGTVEAATNAPPTARSLQLSPSARDKAEAVITKRPPGVSVWDDALTTPAQAEAIMRGDGAPDRPRAPFIARVSAVCAVRAGLEVVAVPRTDTTLPGRDGHAHIEGLLRASGAARDKHEEFLDEVACCFSLMKTVGEGTEPPA